jgi:uncharacterized Zn finger protein
MLRSGDVMAISPVKMHKMNLPKLSESIVRAGSNANSFVRGKELYENGAISNAAIQGNVLTGECEGTQAPYYTIRVELDDAGIRSTSCTCAYDFGGTCKHVVALLLTYVHQPKQFAARKEIAELLSELERDDLIALMTRLLREQPELYDWVEAAIAAPSPGKTKKGRRKKVDEDIYRRQVRNIMHSLDGMRMSDAYWHVGGLVGQLGEVRDSAMKFLDAGDAETALAILLILAEAAGEGIELIDDSDGELGDFAIGLGQPIAEAILSLDLSIVERGRLIDRLKKLDKELDNYGMSGLDVAIEAATYGWDDGPRPQQPARRSMREGDDEFDDEYDDEVDEVDEEDEDEGEWEEGGYANAIWHDPYRPVNDLTEAKLNVLDRQGKTEDYLALCLKLGRTLRYTLKLCDLGRTPQAVEYALENLSSAEDALKLAQRLRELGDVQDAITIGERGLALAGRKAELGEWLGPIEETQGRDPQALTAWHAAFLEKTSLEGYKTIQRLAGSSWPTLRPELIAAARKSYNRQALAEIYLHEEAWDEAIKYADEHATDYNLVALVADAVITHRPEWVIEASRQQAEALIARTQSKYYAHAADWLKRVKAAYSQMGQTNVWQDYLLSLKVTYKRRPALMGYLQRL